MRIVAELSGLLFQLLVENLSRRHYAIPYSICQFRFSRNGRPVEVNILAQRYVFIQFSTGPRQTSGEGVLIAVNVEQSELRAVYDEWWPVLDERATIKEDFTLYLR